MTRTEVRKRLNSERMTATLELLQGSAPIDAMTLAAKIGVHHNTARQWLRTLHSAGQIHIAVWYPDALGRDKYPAYAFGAGQDAAKRKLTRAEISARYRQRKKEPQDVV